MNKMLLGPLEGVMKVLARSPEEKAGILVGLREGGTIRAYYLHLTRNIRESSVEFESEPWHVVQAHVSAEKYGLEVIGVFHTHPSCPPTPSRLDVEGMKQWPYIWVIACRDEVAAWMPGEEPSRIEVG